MLSQRSEQLYVIGIQERPGSSEYSTITFITTRGELNARVHLQRGMRQAVVFLGGDMTESAFDVGFDELSGDLGQRGIASVSIAYRSPGDCAQCAIDALLACQYLDDEGVRDVALVGWSFGASVAAAAGSVARNVRGVAAISAREATEACSRRLRAKPLLLMHGEKDKICSVDTVGRICARADTPRRLIVYPEAGHDLAEVRQQVRSDLIDWLVCALDPVQSSGAVSPQPSPA